MILSSESSLVQLRGTPDDQGKALVLSPHIDDAFLSIAGCMLRAHKHNVLVLDVFGKSTFLHTRKAVSERGVFRIRREEERRATSIVGVDVRIWRYPTALYRSRCDAIGTAKDVPAGMGESIWANVSTLMCSVGCSRVFLPAGTGRHPDHVFLSRWVGRLSAIGFKVFLYEDMPYTAEHRNAVPPEVKAAPASWTQVLVDITSLVSEKKAVCRQYRSQLDDAGVDTILSYAKSLGGDGRYYERLYVYHS